MCPGRAEPNTVKFGNSKANIKLNRFLTNLIIKFDLYVKPLPCQCQTYLIFIWFDAARARRLESLNKSSVDSSCRTKVVVVCSYLI